MECQETKRPRRNVESPGLYSGCDIPEYYDSLIAKLSAYGVNRLDAIRRMRVALEEIEILGVPTTVPLHRELMRDERFVRGEFDTTYLSEILPRLKSAIDEFEKIAALVAAVETVSAPSNRRPGREREPTTRWRTMARAQHMSGK